MKHGVSVALLAALVLVSGCSDDDEPASAPTSTASDATAPAYDGSQEPAAAVLPLVPEEARTLAVTDFDEVRAELGTPDLTSQSPPEEISRFWQRATTERPLLTDGLLRADEPLLKERYGFSQVDVAWEAHFFGADGRELGWVLELRDGTDLGRVEAAVGDGFGPLAGAVVTQDERLLSSGAATDPTQSWATDPEIVAQVGLPANATYVARECTESGPDDGSTEVDDLGAWSVQFEGSLVTARLGEGRHDLFTRMRLGEGEPAFTAAYDGGVADPLTGRIGYVMTDPAAAAELALAGRLPFATCP